MKKLLMLLAVGAMGVSLAAAQGESAEPKAPMYPTAGSIGVGIEADPILNYIGNMFNNSADNSARTHWGKHAPAIYLRYFLFDDAAVRARLEFKSGLASDVRHVRDDAAQRLNPLSRKEVEDLKNVSSQSYSLQLGYQMFRGNHRLKGFYGGDVFYSYMNRNTEYMYGNKMNALNPTPTTSDFSGNATPKAERILLEKGKVTHGFGLNAFTGAEFYFMPQACIGFEVGLYFGAKLAGKGRKIEEKMVGSIYNKLEKTTGEMQTENLSFATDVAKPHGNFYFVFHF